MTQDLLNRSRECARRRVVDVALLTTTVSLVVSIVVAATVVSIGMARADTLGHIADTGSGRFALAIFLAFVIAAMGGLTAVMAPDGEPPQRRD